MNKDEFFKVYQHGVEYVGTPTVLKGSKECKNCKGSMHKIPIRVPFVEYKNGYLPVVVSQVNGKMRLFEGDIETMWVCENRPCKANKY